MRGLTRTMAAAFCVALFTVPATAQDMAGGIRQAPNWGAFSIAPRLGTEIAIAGNFVQGTAIGGPAGTLPIVEQSFLDVYYPPVIFGFDVNYGASHDVEVFGGVHYAHARADEFDLVRFPGGGLPSSAVRGEFTDYQEIGFRVGARRFFNSHGAFRPYVSANIGGVYVSETELTASFDVIPTFPPNLALDDIPFYEQTLTFQGGGAVGVTYDIRPHIHLGIEVGLSYTGSLDEDDSGLGMVDMALGTSTAAANNSGDRLSIPIAARLIIDM